jgi:hypothetical protein
MDRYSVLREEEHDPLVDCQILSHVWISTESYMELRLSTSELRVRKVISGRYPWKMGRFEACKEPHQ